MTFRFGFIKQLKRYVITIVASSKEEAKVKFADKVGKEVQISYLYKERSNE